MPVYLLPCTFDAMMLFPVNARSLNEAIRKVEQGDISVPGEDAGEFEVTTIEVDKSIAREMNEDIEPTLVDTGGEPYTPELPMIEFEEDEDVD